MLLYNILFKCRKCGHELFFCVTDQDSGKDLMPHFMRIAQMDCPECGEEPYDNWIFVNAL